MGFAWESHEICMGYAWDLRVPHLKGVAHIGSQFVRNSGATRAQFGSGLFS